jgi:tungstate transport system ATP-binding protein
VKSAIYTLSGVQHCYGERTVLRIDSLNIDDGERLCIIGPSGAGKSTLLRLLALLEAPSRGTVCVHINGRDVSQANATIEDRRWISMAFQHPILLTRSVRDNVAYGLRARGWKNVDERVDAILERVGMMKLADAPAQSLSGGEIQRTALARMLALEPRVILLDEPTANLDPYNVRIIETLLREQIEQFKATVVMATHNMFQAKRLASRVALLMDGELIEIAPVEQFFDSPQDQRTAAYVSGDLIY